MKKILTLSMLAVFCLVFSGTNHAEAKRFGGGSSFGKSFSNKSAAPAPRMSQQKQAAPSKQAAGSPARGGMMGMLGGLALGGMLGALFFGGAFDGINFFDILILAGIAFAVFWFMRRKIQTASPQNAYAGGAQADQGAEQTGNHDDAFTTSQHAPQTSEHMLRPDIDETHFIPAAKDIFMRMQTAWNQKDMNDIRTFCTTEIADKIESDMQALGSNQTRNEVGMLEANIADAWIESDDEWVAIHFQAMLKEETLNSEGKSLGEKSHETHETWIFRHAISGDDPTWYLAGIQQAG
ncbi:MAG: Tim44-like domain-containing protein [Mariprofundaceae bacterium]|nr:Tim44-like domain-containing protein [Mariprofundaceae bacterium]